MILVVLPRLLRTWLPAPLMELGRRLVWRLPNLSWTLPGGLAVEVRGPADWVLYNDIFVDGEYDPAISHLQINAAGRPVVRVLDLGANVGYFALRLASRWQAGDRRDVPCELTLVEPSTRLSKELERRLAEQPGLAARLRVVSGLVGAKAGEGDYFESPLHFLSSTRPGTQGRHRRLPFVDLCTLYGAEDRIDLLKCDIEGSEELFLASYHDLLMRVDALAIELHPGLCDTARCHALISASGLEEIAVLRKTPAASLHLFARRPLGGRG